MNLSNQGKNTAIPGNNYESIARRRLVGFHDLRTAFFSNGAHLYSGVPAAGPASLRRTSVGATTVHPSGRPGIPIELSFSHGTSTALPWCFRGTSMGLPISREVSVGLPRDGCSFLVARADAYLPRCSSALDAIVGNDTGSQTVRVVDEMEMICRSSWDNPAAAC